MILHFPSEEPRTVSETGRWFLCCRLWWQSLRLLISWTVSPMAWSWSRCLDGNWGKDVRLFKYLILCSLVVCCLFGCRSLLGCSGAQMGGLRESIGNSDVPSHQFSVLPCLTAAAIILFFLFLPLGVKITGLKTKFRNWWKNWKRIEVRLAVG